MTTSLCLHHPRTLIRAEGALSLGAVPGDTARLPLIINMFLLMVRRMGCTDRHGLGHPSDPPRDLLVVVLKGCLIPARIKADLSGREDRLSVLAPTPECHPAPSSDTAASFKGTEENYYSILVN